MCCAWSPGGDLLAGVFQDGLAALWDVRSGDVSAPGLQIMQTMQIICATISLSRIPQVFVHPCKYSNPFDQRLKDSNFWQQCMCRGNQRASSLRCVS